MIGCIGGLLKGIFTAASAYIRKVADESFFDTYNNKTKICGQLLAKAIISHFADRKVTLMGYSMGT